MFTLTELRSDRTAVEAVAALVDWLVQVRSRVCNQDRLSKRSDRDEPGVSA